MGYVEEKTDDYVDADWEAPAPTASRREAGRRVSATKVLSGALVVVVVAALAYSGFELSRQHGRINRLQSQADLQASALAAAKTYGVYLSSYNYGNLTGPSAPWTEVDNHATASFRRDFDSTRANLTALINDYKATAVGTVVQAAVSSATPSRAVALLFIDQKITNTAQKPGTTVQPLRVELVMARQNGKWLIDQLQVPS